MVSSSIHHFLNPPLLRTICHPTSSRLFLVAQNHKDFVIFHLGIFHFIPSFHHCWFHYSSATSCLKIALVCSKTYICSLRWIVPRCGYSRAHNRRRFPAPKSLREWQYTIMPLHAEHLCAFSQPAVGSHSVGPNHQAHHVLFQLARKDLPCDVVLQQVSKWNTGERTERRRWK